jgi:prevent-host-death family protein
MTQITVAEARAQIAEIVNKVAYGKERHTVTRHGKAVVAIIPIEDLKLLEELEDKLDVQAAREALKDKERVPYEEVRRDLGLSK